MAELKATIRMLPDALSDLLEVFSDRVVLKGLQVKHSSVQELQEMMRVGFRHSRGYIVKMCF